MSVATAVLKYLVPRSTHAERCTVLCTYGIWQPYTCLLVLGGKCTCGGTCFCSTCTYYENSVPGGFFAKIVHTNYTRVHWYKGTGVLVPVYWLREQPYVRIRTKLYLSTSWCAMARTAGTSRLLTFCTGAMHSSCFTNRIALVRVRACHSRVLPLSPDMVMSGIGNA